jgi:epsilon-lactone hydrolase
MDDIAQKRQSFDSLGENYPVAEGVHIEQKSIAGVNCFWMDCEEPSTSNKVLVYVHGGCFLLGDINSHKPLVSHMVNRMAIPGLFIEYGLAPEKPYPQGVNDLVGVIREFVETNPNKKLILAGDSAGGGLIATAIPRLVDIKPESIETCVLLSPWVDLSCSSKSFNDNAEIDPVLSPAEMRNFASAYMVDTALAEANPIERLECLFPPTLILVGTNEILIDDSKITHAKIQKQQKKVKLSIYKGQTHVWLMDSIESDATVSALDEIAKFIL